ncbi:MAG: phosphatidylserine decarboxylase [Alphaproteobacteria bacterium]|nr:phosphatidylserine decarboxylase [Alphaproteobacteria bacterium]
MFFAHLIHPEGWRFVAIFAGITILFSLFSPTLGWIGAILTGWCFYFFRNPARVTPARDGLIISPADGKIVAVKEIVPPEDWDIGTDPLVRVSIFLNVFDVHINRIPIKGTVRKVLYHAGKFFNASLDKASDLNERNVIVLDLDDVTDCVTLGAEKIPAAPSKKSKKASEALVEQKSGTEGDDTLNQFLNLNDGDASQSFVSAETGRRSMAFVQIAGLIARRIRCDAKEGDKVNTGAIYGLIRFGSRMDVYLPKGANPLVIEGQRVLAGETVLADLQSSEPARQGLIV